MAKPIKPTPTLTGEYAKKFIHEMEHPVYSEKRDRVIKKAEKVYAEHPF